MFQALPSGIGYAKCYARLEDSTHHIFGRRPPWDFGEPRERRGRFGATLVSVTTLRGSGADYGSITAAREWPEGGQRTGTHVILYWEFPVICTVPRRHSSET